MGNEWELWGPLGGLVGEWEGDGGLDTAVASHEWGHVLSNRLISNGNGLRNNQGGGMGEGFGDFVGLMTIIRSSDIAAAEAANWGLINEVVPHAQLMERAEKLARHIVTLPPAAVRMMKEFVIRFGNLPDDQAWHIQNLMNSMLIQTTMDGEEGRAAFNAKRPPNFTGTLRKRGEPWPEPSEEDAKRLDEAYRSGEY